MPGRRIVGGYRYQYQGQEVDPETGKEAFQLRLWDGRIGRWLTTDPAGQYASPYLGMGNNPITRVDPDGGVDWVKDGDNYVWDENVTSATDIDLGGREYIGKNLSDIKSHFFANTSFLSRWFGDNKGGWQSKTDFNSYTQAKAPSLVNEIFKNSGDMWKNANSKNSDEYPSFSVTGDFTALPFTTGFDYEINIGGNIITAKGSLVGESYNALGGRFNQILFGKYEVRNTMNGIDRGTIMLGRVGTLKSDIIKLQFKNIEDIHLIEKLVYGRNVNNTINISKELKN